MTSSLTPRVGVGGGIRHDRVSSPTSFIGPPTLTQEILRVIRRPRHIKCRNIARACIVCGSTPAVRCCEFGADIA